MGGWLPLERRQVTFDSCGGIEALHVKSLNYIFREPSSRSGDLALQHEEMSERMSLDRNIRAVF